MDASHSKPKKDECFAQSVSVGRHVTSEAKDRCTDGVMNSGHWGRSRFFSMSFLICLEALHALVGLEVVCFLGA